MYKFKQISLRRNGYIVLHRQEKGLKSKSLIN